MQIARGKLRFLGAIDKVVRNLAHDATRKIVTHKRTHYGFEALYIVDDSTDESVVDQEASMMVDQLSAASPLLVAVLGLLDDGYTYTEVSSVLRGTPRSLKAWIATEQARLREVFEVDV